jgi:hypothetical protein
MTATTAVTNVPVVSEAVALRRPKPLRMLWVTAVWGACFVASSWGCATRPSYGSPRCAPSWPGWLCWPWRASSTARLRRGCARGD